MKNEFFILSFESWKKEIDQKETLDVLESPADLGLENGNIEEKPVLEDLLIDEDDIFETDNDFQEHLRFLFDQFLFFNFQNFLIKLKSHIYPAGKHWYPGRPEDVPLQRLQEVS